jgi:hypothetical protein
MGENAEPANSLIHNRICIVNIFTFEELITHSRGVHSAPSSAILFYFLLGLIVLSTSLLVPEEKECVSVTFVRATFMPDQFSRLRLSIQHGMMGMLSMIGFKTNLCYQPIIIIHVLYFTSVVFLNKNAGVARQARAAR